MTLKREVVTQGNFLFRYRGTLPLIVLAAGLGVFAWTIYKQPDAFSPFLSGPYRYICLAVCLLGQIVRIVTVGYTPKDTSDRNWAEQIANVLNTTGMYSMVRHPLYLGNFLMWLGIAMLTANFWLILAFIFFYWIYYERIMFAEENFLEQKFGEVYTEWAGHTPAFIPALGQYKKPMMPFSWKKVMKNEKNGFNAITLLFYIFQMTEEFITTGHVFTRFNFWFWAMVFGLTTYFTLKFLKKGTNLLDEPGR